MKREYRNESSDPKRNAQRNLQGRTHYVDDDTLKFHKSRIISAHDTANGLLFWIITSDALDMHNTKRGFRYVIFDVFGSVIERPELENAFKTSDKAREAMREVLSKIDAVSHTLKAIDAQAQRAAHDFDELRQHVKNLKLISAA